MVDSISTPKLDELPVRTIQIIAQLVREQSQYREENKTSDDSPDESHLNLDIANFTHVKAQRASISSVYSAWLVLPVLATSLVLLPLLMFGVYNDEELVPRRLETPDVEPKTALIDRNGAIFGSTLLAITLVSLVTLSAVNLLHGVEGVWTVTAPAAILMLCRDIWHDLRHGGFQDKQPDMKTQGSGS
ncbi:hypothetical protein QFC21_002163 [Naganishia friedmannii]|uniref:Uncharacterized protein n=1 Tax=Naganishia friedmannii TaxID=89922 RepID=A0ACC2VYV5_9TREE|nr:hypothetical protein QFC21_002163 [Naganishia friedmannii]